MLWFFERAGVRLQCELRAAEDETNFELVWTSPDGHLHVERSDDPAALTTRRRRLEEELKLEGWTRLGRETPAKRFL
jgi:hypothetical protein